MADAKGTGLGAARCGAGRGGAHGALGRGEASGGEARRGRGVPTRLTAEVAIADRLQMGEEGRAMPSARSPKPGAMIAPGWAISSSATSASVVSISAATEAACSKDRRVTRTGSITPLSKRSPNSPVSAFRPCPAGIARTWSIVACPS